MIKRSESSSRKNSGEISRSNAENTIAQCKITRRTMPITRMEATRVGKRSTLPRSISSRRFLLWGRKVSSRVVWTNPPSLSQLTPWWITKSLSQLVVKADQCPNRSFGSLTIGTLKLHQWNEARVSESILMVASCRRSKLITLARHRKTLIMLGEPNDQRPFPTGQLCGMVKGKKSVPTGRPVTFFSNKTWALMRANHRLVWSKIIGGLRCPFAPWTWARIEANLISWRACSRVKIVSRLVMIPQY